MRIFVKFAGFISVMTMVSFISPQMGFAMDRAAKAFENSSVVDLARAAEAGDLDKVRQMLNAGADIKAVGREGMTITHFALLARKNKPQMMDMVLTAGADPISTLSSEDTVPQYAVSRDNADPEVVKVLFDHGIGPNWRPESGTYKDSSLLMEAVMGDNLPVMKLLVERGADINYVHPISGSALHRALDGTDFFKAAFLVEAGIDLTLLSNTSPRIKNPKRRTAIERFCVLEGGKRGHNPLPEIAAGWKVFVDALAKRGVTMPCGL